MKHKVNMLFCAEVKGHQILSFVTKGWHVPLFLLSNILVHFRDNFSNHLHFRFEWMIEFTHELIDLFCVTRCCGDFFHSDSPLVIAVARARSNSRSGTFCVSEAARLNSSQASLKRPSFARRSPRTLGRRW